MLKFYVRFISILLTSLMSCANVNSAYAINWGELGVAIRKLVTPAAKSADPLLLKPKEIPPELKIPPSVFVQPARTLNEKIQNNSGNPQLQNFYDTNKQNTPDNRKNAPDIAYIVTSDNEVERVSKSLATSLIKSGNARFAKDNEIKKFLEGKKNGAEKHVENKKYDGMVYMKSPNGEILYMPKGSAELLVKKGQ